MKLFSRFVAVAAFAVGLAISGSAYVDSAHDSVAVTAVAGGGQIDPNDYDCCNN